MLRCCMICQLCQTREAEGCNKWKMIFIEQFWARWPWSISVLESRLSMSSSSEVPASSKEGRNPENGRSRDFGRRQYRQSGFQHTDWPRPSSPDCSIKIITPAVKASVNSAIRLFYHRSIPVLDGVVVRTLAIKLEARVQVPVQDRISLFQFYN